MARDVITLIEQDHRELQRIFQRLRAGEGDRELLFQQMAALLEAHSRAEEAEVYPEIARVDSTEQMRHAREEHAEADELLIRLMSMDPGSVQFRRMLTQLMDAVDEHIREEEAVTLPALRRGTKADQRARLADAFVRRRGEELARGPSHRQVGGSELSREKLYERAREMDIPGRSHMSREQLREAVHGPER